MGSFHESVLLDVLQCDLLGLLAYHLNGRWVVSQTLVRFQAIAMSGWIRLPLQAG